MHGVEPYTTEHAQYFQDEEVVMPTTIVLDSEANVVQTDVAFLHFLLNYFHRALQPVLRKVCVVKTRMYIKLNYADTLVNREKMVQTLALRLFAFWYFQHVHVILLFFLPPFIQTGTLSVSVERQRYSISSRSQLNDHMSRLLGHLFSPVHDNHMRSAVVKEFWALNDARLILNFALTSNFKKLVS